MTCREVIDFLADYLDGSLHAEVRSAFEAHLSACRRCREYLETYQNTVTMARSLGVEEPGQLESAVPDDLIRAILTARTRVV